MGRVLGGLGQGFGLQKGSQNGKINVFNKNLDFLIIREGFGEGLGRVWGRSWEGFGKVLGRFWEPFGRSRGRSRLS